MSPARIAILAIVGLAIMLFPVAGYASSSTFPARLATNTQIEAAPALKHGHVHGRIGKAGPAHPAHHKVNHAHQAFALNAVGALRFNRCKENDVPNAPATFEPVPPTCPYHPPKHVSPTPEPLFTVAASRRHGRAVHPHLR